MKKHTLALISVMLTTPFAMAADEIPVTITGEITAPAGADTCTASAANFELNFDGDTDNWVAHESHEFRFNVPDTGNDITIDCGSASNGTTKVTFATNDTSSQNPLGGCGENNCTSYPVVFMPDISSCDQDCMNNLTQGHITMNLTAATCSDGSTSSDCAGGTATQLHSAEVNVPDGQTATATFSGTLFSNSGPNNSPFPGALGTDKGPKGTVTPRQDTTPTLYVIYGG